MSGRTPRQVAVALAKTLGVHLDDTESGTGLSILVESPRGKHWRSGGVHCMRVEARPTTQLQKDDLWIDVIERMTLGLDECDLNNQDCADHAFD